MDHFAIASFLMFVTSLANGIFVFLSPPRNLLKSLWSLVCITVAIVGIYIFQLLTAPDAVTAYGYAFVVNTAVYFIPVFFLHTTLLLTNRHQQKMKEMVLYYMIVVVYTVIVMIYPQHFISAEPVFSFKFYGHAQPLFYFVPFFFAAMMLYGLVILFRSYRNAAAIKRNQLKYFFIGCVLGVFGGGMAFFPILHIPIYPWGVYLVPVSMMIIAYAIVKHQLMDIHVVLRRSIVYTLLLSLLTVLFFVFVFVLERIFQHVVGYSSIIGSAASIILIAVFAVPIHNTIRTFIDQLFYRENLSQVTRENVRLQEEMLALERYKTFSEIARALKEEIREPLERMKESPDRTAREQEIRNIEDVLAELHEYSQPWATDFKVVNIIEVLDQLFEGTGVVKYYQPNDIVKVLGDAEQLQKAFAHIIGHCIQSIREGGDIFVTVERDKKWAEISIRHSGQGLSPEEAKRLFEPFFKTDRFKCGLQMVLTQAIIFQHNGKIQIDSEEDVGTEFLVELPIL